MREAAPAVFVVEPARQRIKKFSAQLFLPRRLSFLILVVSEAAVAVTPVLVVMNLFAISLINSLLQMARGGGSRGGAENGNPIAPTTTRLLIHWLINHINYIWRADRITDCLRKTKPGSRPCTCSTSFSPYFSVSGSLPWPLT
jgi:hypothetical protein